MNNSNPDIEDESSVQATACRQWLCFPADRLGVPESVAPQTYCVLVVSACRRLAVARVVQRTAPSRELGNRISALIDERALALASCARLAGEFGERHGITLEFLDLDIDAESPLQWPMIVSRRVLQCSLAAARGENAGTSLLGVRDAALLELQEEWTVAAGRFIDTLNPEAVRRARALAGLRPSSYNYLNGTYLLEPEVRTPHRRGEQVQRASMAGDVAHGEDGEAASSSLGRDRAQALAIFPFLHRLITRHEYESVRKAIDGGGKLIDALAIRYNVSRGIIRILRGLTERDLGRWTYQLDVIVPLLKYIPADWWPRTPDAWRRFVVAIDSITRTTRHPITTSSNMLWLYQSARHGFDLSVGEAEDLARIGQDIDEFLDLLRRALVWTLRRSGITPKASPGIRTIAIVSRMKADLGLVKLSEITRRFGDAYGRATLRHVEEAQMLKGLRWPTLGGNAVYGEIEVVPLLTPESLMEEGIRMGNCVASYVQQCTSGKSQIWSLQLSDGTRLSTLETRVPRTASARKHVIVVQHKGTGNGPPPTLAQDVAKRHMECLNAHPTAIADYLEWRETITRTPLSERQRQALMLPTLSALEETLPKKWTLAKLVEAARHA